MEDKHVTLVLYSITLSKYRDINYILIHLINLKNMLYIAQPIFCVW